MRITATIGLGEKKGFFKIETNDLPTIATCVGELRDALEVFNHNPEVNRYLEDFVKPGIDKLRKRPVE